MSDKQRRGDDEPIEIFYCVSPRTFEVERIHRTRRGVLKKDGRVVGSLLGTRRISDEAEICFSLGYAVVVGMAVGAEDTPWGKAKIAELEAEAASLKAANPKHAG